jgi:DNA topoisomerase IB
MIVNEINDNDFKNFFKYTKEIKELPPLPKKFDTKYLQDFINEFESVQQENARLKEKNQKAFKIVDEKLTNLNLTYGVDNEFREEYDELWEILKEN